MSSMYSDSRMHSRYSLHSGHKLPDFWLDQSPICRREAVGHLRRQMRLCQTYKQPIGLEWFDNAHYSDRWAVINHLIRAEQILPMPPLPAKIRIYSGTPGRGQLLANVDMDVIKCYGGAPGGGKSKTASLVEHFMKTNEIMHDLPFQFKTLQGEFRYAPLHEAPNGGKRILKSFYTQLRKFWVRATGQPQEISEMNDGHLRNTLDLLKESHGNLIARSTFLLGKMHMHFANQPLIRQELEDLCHHMQAVEVDDLYPVWKELAKELAARTGPTVHDTGYNFDLFADDDLRVMD